MTLSGAQGNGQDAIAKTVGFFHLEIPPGNKRQNANADGSGHQRLPLYVDHTQLVKITLLARDKELALIVSNTVRPDAKPGTGLGLQNCAQILRLHSGRFEHSLSEGVFTAAAYFPME